MSDPKNLEVNKNNGTNDTIHINLKSGEIKGNANTHNVINNSSRNKTLSKVESASGTVENKGIVNNRNVKEK